VAPQCNNIDRGICYRWRVSGLSLVSGGNEPTLWKASNIDHVTMIYHKVVYSAELKLVTFAFRCDNTTHSSSEHNDNLISVAAKRRWWYSSACQEAGKSVVCNSSIGHFYISLVEKDLALRYRVLHHKIWQGHSLLVLHMPHCVMKFSFLIVIHDFVSSYEPYFDFRAM
jgi:hypothetical protein